MKKLTVGALMTLAVLALAAVIASQAATTRASDDNTPNASSPYPQLATEADPTSPEDTSRLKSSAQAAGEDDDVNRTPFVGIIIRTLSPAEADELGEEGGVEIQRVLADGPAAEILHDGDVIIAIDGNAVTNAGEVVDLVRAADPGDLLSFTVIRDGQRQEVEVTVGEHEAPVATHRAGFPDLRNRLLGRLQSPADSFVSAEIVVETETGFETIRAVVGTVSSVDADAGVFVLAPKDGSDPITYTVSDATVVNLRHTGDLSGLNTGEETLVVDVDGDVTLVSQGDLSPGHRMGSVPGFGHGMRLQQRFRRAMPYLGDIGGDIGNMGRLRGRIHRLQDSGGLGDRLGSILPPDVLERLEQLRSGRGSMDLDIDIQVEGLRDAVRDLVCNEDVNEGFPDRVTVLCSNTGLEDAQ